MPYIPYGYQPGYYGQAMPDQLAQLRQNAYQQPMMGQAAQQTQGTPSIIWVQGEEGAKAYMVAAGNSVLLMDSETARITSKAPMQAVCRFHSGCLTTRSAPQPQKRRHKRRSSPAWSLSPGQSLTRWQPAVRHLRSKSLQNLKRRSNNYVKSSF